MRIVIIEDELPAFKRLSKLIRETWSDSDIVAHLDSIAQTTGWFATQPLPDVVFMDIHLSDGSAFDLLKHIKVDCPIIFTTAYDAYALDAFKTSGIDYLLKPVKQEDLLRAFQKLQQLRPAPPLLPLTGPVEYKKRFVIRYGEHIRTLPVEEVAYFYSENKATFARTFEGRTYPMDHNLDALEPMLDPDMFFRINRQYLIFLKSIGEMKIYTKARVIVTLNPPAKEQPIVSSEKAARFKQWLGG